MVIFTKFRKSIINYLLIHLIMVFIFRPDKRKYIGGWKNGKQHGKGTFFTSAG